MRLLLLVVLVGLTLGLPHPQAEEDVEADEADEEVGEEEIEEEDAEEGEEETEEEDEETEDVYDEEEGSLCYKVHPFSLLEKQSKFPR